jgi:5S rRNA maturation endonuclease (ribonuclease M5)
LKGRGIHQLAFQLHKTLDAEAPTPLNHQNRVAQYVKTPSIPNLPLALGNNGEKYLLSRKLTKESITKWKLLYWEEMDAIVIPIEDVGYIMRTIKEKMYKTLPGTKIGSTLFGLSQFNPLSGAAIIVEGSFDCIWMHQLGFTNTLAILHSDLTMQQYKLLQGVTGKVYIMLDGDKAGQDAATKIRQRLKSNFIVKTLQMPFNKDPDDLNKAQILTLLNESR